MWTYAFFLFALCGGGLVRSEISCEGGVKTACSVFFENRPSFPKTPEDLEELCPKLQAEMDCVQNYFDQCEDDTFDDKTNLPKIRTYLIEVCRDSALRADIVREFPCIKQVAGDYNETCHNNARAAMLKYLEENNLDHDEDSPSFMKYYCFFLTAKLSCLAADVGATCGMTARDLVLDAHMRMGYLDNTCLKEEMDELLQLVPVLEFEVEHKERIGSILRTHKGSDN